MAGKIYLIPMTLGDIPVENVIPDIVKRIINSIDVYIVENVRTTRRYLSKCGIEKPINELVFFELNKFTKPHELEKYIEPIFQNQNIGIVSEAGIAGVADPGAEIVKLAHKKGIQVVPLSGPSSIILALSASGMNGQNFAFNGYLPVNSDERKKQILFLEKRSKTENQAQIFMETPYRNNQMIDDILSICNLETNLCIATDITLDTEFIRTQNIQLWKVNKPNLNKRPTIFIIMSK